MESFTTQECDMRHNNDTGPWENWNKTFCPDLTRLKKIFTARISSGLSQMCLSFWLQSQGSSLPNDQLNSSGAILDQVKVSEEWRRDGNTSLEHWMYQGREGEGYFMNRVKLLFLPTLAWWRLMAQHLQLQMPFGWTMHSVGSWRNSPHRRLISERWNGFTGNSPIFHQFC